MRRRPQRPPVPIADASARVLCGANPVLELLRAVPAAIEAVVVLPNARAAQVVIELARAHDIAVEVTDRPALDRLSGGAHHQGVAARTRAFTYASFDRVLDAGRSLLVALDGITDPQN